MCTEAFDAWLSLFNENAAVAWTVERKELRNAAMLLNILDSELKEIHKAVSDKFYMWQKKLDSIDDLKKCSQGNQVSSQPKKSFSQEQKENRKPENYNPIVGIEPLHSLDNKNQAFLNADAFLKSSGKSEVEFKQYIYKSPQQEKEIIDETSTSPKINKSRKFSRLKRPRDITNSYSLLDVTRTPKITPEMVICDSFTSTPDKTCKENETEATIIDVTPEPPHETKRIKHSKLGNLLNQKKNFKFKGQKNNKVTSNSTLTQMFSNVAASTKNEESIKKHDVDLTFCPIINIESCGKYSEQKQDSDLDDPSKKECGDTDLTYCPTSDINLMAVKNNNKVQPVDSVPKACLPNFQDEGNTSTKDTLHQQTLTTPTKSKIPFKYKMKPVRGKERLKLEGWDCEECKKFYEGIGENFLEAKNLMNKCSRHRSKFKPEDYTAPGFWDLNFTPTQHTDENESTIFHF